MTDKQIIIDGVNVKDCKRRIGKDNYCRYYKRPCAENNYNCIWKKYLRKEQECEELKEELKIIHDDCKGCSTCNEALNNARLYAQENAELKAENETYKKMLDDKEVQLALTEIRSGERHLRYNKAEKLKQTLTEIKEFVENEMIPNCDTSIILQKISECEVNNE